MTTKDFNVKYKDFLEKDFVGLELESKEAIAYLDSEFQKLILIDGFKYQQIKQKFGEIRFYNIGIPNEITYRIEKNVQKIYDNLIENDIDESYYTLNSPNE